MGHFCWRSAVVCLAIVVIAGTFIFAKSRKPHEPAISAQIQPAIGSKCQCENGCSCCSGCCKGK